MSSNEKDMQAKEAARRAARASKPGAVSVSAEEAARLDQRIADKLDANANATNANAPTNLQALEGDVAAKQRGRSTVGTPSKPGAYAESNESSTPAGQLRSLENDVAAKVRASGGAAPATRPGVQSVRNDDNDAVSSKVARTFGASTAASRPGAQAVVSNSNNDPVASKIRRDAAGAGGAPSQLASLEDNIAAKVRSNDPAATTPGAFSVLKNREDSVAAKVRHDNGGGGAATTTTPGALRSTEDAVAAKIRRDGGGSVASAAAVATGARASLQAVEDSIAAKIRRETPSSTTTPGALASMEDSVAAKVQRDTAARSGSGRGLTPGAQAQLNNLEDSIASKVRGAGPASSASTVGARAELGSLEDSVAAKVRSSAPSSSVAATQTTPGALSELNRLEDSISAKVTAANPTSTNIANSNNKEDSKPGAMVTKQDSASKENSSSLNKDARLEQPIEKEEELMPHHSGGTQAVTTTADRGIATSPDVEFGMVGNGEGLAVAVAVEEDDEDMFIPSAVEYDPDAKPPIYKNRRFRLYVFLALFIVVVVVVGAAIGVTFGKPDEVAEPTMAPTSAREALGIRDSVERVYGAEVLADPESPYSKALDWITFDDPMQLIPSDANFIQRYTAAYLYFATTQDGPWRSCNPPENAWEESPVCNYKLLAFLFPETYDDVPSNAWLSNINECEWAGMVCDSQGQVRSIDLSAGYLSGPFPEGIYNLPFLQDLSLYWNNMTGTLPSKVTEMKHLVSIELHYNHFTGTVPTEWWNAKNLQRINIGENLISGSIPTEVKNLRDVKGLFIMTNLMTGTIPEEIGELESITYVRGSRNFFEGQYPATVTNLTNAVELWMHRNLMNGTIPEDINKMELLVDLRLHVNQHTGKIPEAVWDMPVLERFEVDENYITGTLSSSIAKMGEQLYSLHVSNNLMHGPLPTEISQMSSMWSLWLNGNDFTGTIPQALCDLKGDKLKEVLIEFTADCAADSEGFIELTCPDGCCTSCCKPDGTDCLETGSGTGGSEGSV